MPSSLKSRAVSKLMENYNTFLKGPPMPKDKLKELLGIEDETTAGLEDTKYTIPEMSVGGRKIKLGSFKVTEAYASFSIPLALYALQQMITDIGVDFVVAIDDFAASPRQQIIKTDTNSTATAFVDYFTIYKGMLLTCQLAHGVLAVTIYADSELAATSFFADLTEKIRTCNFYKGKCLYFTGNEIDFKKTPDTGWDDVIVEDDLRKEIHLNVESFFSNEEYRKMKLYKRGIILYGPPGTGKTSIVRAIFSRLEGAGVTRVYLTNETFYSMDMSTFFKTLQYLLPAVVVFEDIDLIGADRNQSRSRVIGGLLNHLDGVDKQSEPLVVIGTTNDLSALDEALRNRPSRFDRCLEVPAPKPEQVAQLYKKLTGFEVPKGIVSLSEGFTGAHIEETVKTAYMLSLADGKLKDDITHDELLKNLILAAKYIAKSFPIANKATTKPAGFGAGTKKHSDDDYSEDATIADKFDPDNLDPPNAGNLI
jgi:hypothetical protein